MKCMGGGFATYAFLCYCGSTALPYKGKASSSGSVCSFLLCITGSSRACQRAVAWTSCPTPQHEELSREPLWGSTAQQGEGHISEDDESVEIQRQRVLKCTETSFTSWPISSIVLKRLLKSMMSNGFHMGGKEAWNG